MKIILVNPPFSFDDLTGKTKSMTKVMNVIPPLGLCYIAAYLEKNDYDVSIIDGQLVDYAKTLNIIEKEQPDIIGIGSTTPAFPSALKLAEEIKIISPNTFIAIGGNHIARLVEETLQFDCFDVGVLGEAETTFLELVKSIEAKGKNELKEVKGLAFKDNGKIIITERGGFIRNLDELPFPARHLIPPPSEYHPTPASYKRLPHADLITSRGCPYTCTFCDNGIFGPSYRERSPENVMEEVELLINKYNVRDIKFFDDVFTLNKKRAHKICELFAERKIDIPWACLTRADLVDKDTLMKMKKSGCWQVLFGIESGDQRILDLIRKKTTVEQNIKAVRLAHEAGLSVRADYLFGIPGDSMESMKKTLNFAINLNTDLAHFNKFTPYPGNEIYEELIKQDYKFDFLKNCTQLDHGDTLYVPDGVDKEEYLQFIDNSYRKYYLRPKYILKQIKSIRSFWDIKRFYNGFMAVAGL